MTSEPTESAPPRAPDRPVVPRRKRSILAGIVVGFCTLVVGGYAALAFTQHELRSVQRDEIPGSVRSSPGGYRSYHFWHSGYHGGK